MFSKDIPLCQDAMNQIHDLDGEADKADKIAKDVQNNASAIKESLGQYRWAWGLVSDACVKLGTKARCAGTQLVSRFHILCIHQAVFNLRDGVSSRRIARSSRPFSRPSDTCSKPSCLSYATTTAG